MKIWCRRVVVPRVALVLVVAASILIPPAKGASHAPEVNALLIGFRYDDYSALSPTEVEQEIISIFADVKGHHTFAVIPEVWAGLYWHSGGKDENLPLPAQKADLLRQAIGSSGLEVALHGLTHRSITVERRHTEFAGRPQERQLAMLLRGKALLEEAVGTRVRTFVPPWNTYDANTVNALQETGLSTLSGNTRDASPDGLPASTSIRFLPTTCGPSGVREAVDRYRRSSARRAVLVVCYHPFDFQESGMPAFGRRCSLQELRELVTWCAQQPDVRLCSLGEISELCRDTLGADRLTPNEALARPGNPFIDRTLGPDRIVYWEAGRAARLSAMMRALAAAWYPGLLVLPAVLGLAAVRILSRWRGWCAPLLVCTGALAFLLLLGYSTRDARPHPEAVFAVIAAAAFAAGAWLATLRRTRT